MPLMERGSINQGSGSGKCGWFSALYRVMLIMPIIFRLHVFCVTCVNKMLHGLKNYRSYESPT